MNSSGFHLLVRNFTALTPGEYAQLQDLSEQYPYSQLIHVMKARASRDLTSADHQSTLHKAAVYATDRGVVKWAMTLPVVERMEKVMTGSPAIKTPATPDAGLAEAGVHQPVTTLPDNSLEGDLLREDLAKELNRLQQLKREFEASYETLKRGIKQETAANPAITKTEDPVLIEEIKSNKKKIKAASPKVIEQNEIIDKFIKTAPAIPKPKSSTPETDLAEDSAVYSDNIVSETLVSILVKQGKNNKAIEMLKKLIWKFPQKKAYFAAQIEALKN